MKKLLLLSLMLISIFNSYAQRDVTKFLGIPVDGYKPEMIQKLKGKGFVYSPKDDVFTGEFNGSDVMVKIATNNNKVCRIMLTDIIGSDEAGIKIRYNKLVRQFEKNKRYIVVEPSKYIISEDEDISYEMSIHSKRYDAIFYQKGELTAEMDPEEAAEEAIKRPVWFMINKLYSKYYIVLFYDNEWNKADGEDL